MTRAGALATVLGAGPEGVGTAFGVVLVLIALAAGVLAVVLGSRRRQRKIDALQQWAARNGWRYAAEDPALERRWAGVPFENDSRPSATGVLYGSVNGWPAVWFLYSWEDWVLDGSGDHVSGHATRYGRQMMALTLPAALPELLVMPSTLASKVRGAFGARGLQLGAPEFDRRWQVRADDEALARYLLHPALQRFLAQHCTGCSFRIAGDSILLWQEGARTVDVLPLYQWRLTEFARMVPPDVWTRFGAGRRPAAAEPWWQSRP